jgi:thiamine biosynthesis lipoprotein
MVSLRRLRPALGTFLSVRCCAPDQSMARAAIEAAFAAVDRVDQLMHPSRVGSDLRAVCELGVGTLDVDRWTWGVLQAAARLHAESLGLFDPSVGDRPGRMTDIRLIAPYGVATGREIAIDLGGIAKGFAVDRAVEALRAHGCPAGEVNAGGDLRVFGSASTQVWIRGAGGVRPIALCDAACAVSNAAAIGRPIEHRGYRRYGDPVDCVVLSAAIIAPSALWADALATYAMVCRTSAEYAQFSEVLALHDAHCVELCLRGEKKPGCWPG